MKRTAIRMFAAAMAFVVLAASSGVVLLSHTCFTSKSSDVSLFSRDGCCSDVPCEPDADAHGTAAVDGKCCDLKSDYLKVQVAAPADVISTCSFFHVSLPLQSVTNSGWSSPEFTQATLVHGVSPPCRGVSPDFIISVHQLLI